MTQKIALNGSGTKRARPDPDGNWQTRQLRSESLSAGTKKPCSRVRGWTNLLTMGLTGVRHDDHHDF